MNTISITVGEETITLPDSYQVVNSMPNDPPASVPVMTQTDMGTAFVLLYPIPSTHAMPYEDTQAVIDGIHTALSENQGLVQVANGTTSQERRYMFSIVKTRTEQDGLSYGLTLDVDATSHTIHVQGFFEEGPITGMRAAVTSSLLVEKGIVEQDMSNWTADPYDPAIDWGYLANLGEAPKFDELFPNHPLTLARNLVTQIASCL